MQLNITKYYCGDL